MYRLSLNASTPAKYSRGEQSMARRTESQLSHSDPRELKIGSKFEDMNKFSPSVFAKLITSTAGLYLVVDKPSVEPRCNNAFANVLS